MAAVDIDIAEPDLALRLERLCRERLGDTAALRIGRAPKRLLVYRAVEPFRGIRRAPLEVLGLGQQFVAQAIHPDTGRPYDWPEETLADIDISTCRRSTPPAPPPSSTRRWSSCRTSCARRPATRRCSTATAAARRDPRGAAGGRRRGGLRAGRGSGG